MRTTFGLMGFIFCFSNARAAEPTFHKDVAPILFSQCATCHREGEIGPFPLLKFEDAKKKAKQIAAVTKDRTMPPWKPEPGHGEFLEARVLSDKQIQTLQDWVKAGTPEGDAKDSPPMPKFSTGWKLGKPDLIFKMPKAFKIPAEGMDVYRQFVFPLDLKEDIHVVGVECRPGNPKVAHHAVGILDNTGAARKFEAKTKDGQPGYPGIGPGFLPAGFTPGYVPGQTPRFLPEGVAITIRKGTDLVLQMHYHPSGKEETDRTEIGFYLSKKPPTKPIVGIGLATEEVDIAAGDKKYARSDEYTLPADMTVTDIWPHMHTIGKSVAVTAKLPSGKTKELLKIKDWDFNWQDTYRYKEAFKLPKGTVVTCDWTWDNSKENARNPFSPPKRIRHGEGSNDEMGGLWIGGYSDDWPEAIAHWTSLVGHYLAIGAKGWVYKNAK